MAEVVAGIEAAIIAFRTLQSVYQDVRDRYTNSATNRSRVELCDDHIRAMDHRLAHLSHSYAQVSPYLTPSARHVWQDELADISACMRQLTTDASDLANVLPRAPESRDPDQSAITFAARKVVCQARAFASANEVVGRVSDLNTKLGHLRQKTFDCIDRLETKRIGIVSAAAIQSNAMATLNNANTNNNNSQAHDSASLFTPCHTGTIPPLHPDTVLRFDDPGSCEGRLFAALCSTFPPSLFASTSISTAATTASTPVALEGSDMSSVLVALGVSGMGGVGKSTALIGLAHHPTIQALFPDGVYFMTLGKDAGEREVVSELATLVSATGGQLQDDSESSTHVQRAVQATVEWFQEQRVLFVVDDVWAYGLNRPVGYIPELKRLLTCSEHCRLVCSTRSHAIAQEAGTPIAFASRDATGLEARTMLLLYADIPYDAIYGHNNINNSNNGVHAAGQSLPPTSTTSSNRRSATPTFPTYQPQPGHTKQPQCTAPHARPVVDDILTKCCGVPLTIGVAGRGVRRYMQSNSRSFSNDYYAALKAYRDDLYSHGYNVSEEALGNYPNFRSAVDVSLDLAQKALQQRLMRSSFSVKAGKQKDKQAQLPPNLSHLFRKLCVLGKARRVPLDIFTRLWPQLLRRHCLLLVNQLIDLNLVICAKHTQRRSSSSSSSSAHTYGLHDLVHDYCESSARDEGVYELYHSEFLESFKPKKAKVPQYDSVDSHENRNRDTTEYANEYNYDDDNVPYSAYGGVGGGVSHDDDDIFNITDGAGDSYDGYGHVDDDSGVGEKSVHEQIPEFVIRAKVDSVANAWWCQAPSDNEKRYLFANLARHLREANRVAELVALLSSLQWVALRAHRGHGGIIALTADFDVLISYITSDLTVADPPVNMEAVKPVLSDITMLRNAARTFWPYVSRNSDELRTQAYARLLGVGGWLVHRFLATSPPAQLRPLHRYWPVPSTRDDARMSVHGPVSCVAALWKKTWDDHHADNNENNNNNNNNSNIMNRDADKAALKTRQSNGAASFIDENSMMSGGERAVTAVGRDLVFIDLASLTSVVSWNAHDYQIDAVAWATRANIVVSASSQEGCIKTWNAATKLLSSFRLQPDSKTEPRCNILSLDCDAHAQRIVVACEKYPSLRMWWPYKRKWAEWPDMSFPESVAYPVLCAAISDDGARIAVGVADGNVWIIDADTGNSVTGVTNMNRPSSICHANCAPVRHIALLPDGRRGISASEDSVLVWNVDADTHQGHDDYNHLRLLRQPAVLPLPDATNSTVRSVALSTEGKHAAVAWHNGCVRVHKIDIDASEVKEACGTLRHERGVRALISPDGCAVLSVAERDRTVRIWNAGPDRHAGLPRTVHSRIVRMVDLGDGAHVAVSACRDGKVRLWDLAKYWARRQRLERRRRQIHRHDGDDDYHRYSDEDDDDFSYEYGANTGATVDLVDCALTVPTNDFADILNISASAATAGGKSQGRKSVSVGLMDDHQGNSDLPRRKTMGSGRVSAVAVNKDGTRVIVARQGDGVQVLDCSPFLEGDGSGRGSGGGYNNSRRRGGGAGGGKGHYRTESINNQISYYCSSNVLNSRHIRRTSDSFRLSNDAFSASSSSSAYNQRRFDNDNSNNNNNVVSGYSLLRRHHNSSNSSYSSSNSSSSSDKVLCVSTCATGRTIVCGGADGSARVWRGRACVSEVRKNGGGVMAVDISLNGRFVGCAARDGRVRLWDDHLNVETVFDGHHGVATCVSVSGDGRRMVSGGYDCTVRVYDIGRNDNDSSSNIRLPFSSSSAGDSSSSSMSDSTTSKRECVLRGHEAVVRAVALSECGRVIVCGGMDCKLRVWSCRGGLGAECGGGMGRKKNSSSGGLSGSSGLVTKTSAVAGDENGKWECHSYSVAAEVYSVSIASCDRLGSLLVMCGLGNGQVLFHELRI